MCCLTCHGVSAGTAMLQAQSLVSPLSQMASLQWTASPWRHFLLPFLLRRTGQSYTMLGSRPEIVVRDGRSGLEKYLGVKNVLKDQTRGVRRGRRRICYL